MNSAPKMHNNSGTSGASGGRRESSMTTGGNGSSGSTRTMNGTAPRTGTRPMNGSGASTLPPTNSTSYRYKNYSGPSSTTIGGRTVFVDTSGAYYYYRGGPVIGYMPGYTPVYVGAPVHYGGQSAMVVFLVVAGLVVVGIVVFAAIARSR